MRPGSWWPAAVVVIALAIPARAERIQRFETDIDVRADGSFAVEERIRWDFEGAVRHGIFREIPIAYERPGTADFHIDLLVLGVTDAQGREQPIKKTRSGGYLRVRIGDPERTVTGVQDYRIRYRVRRALLFFPDHDELYWNATGTEWPVPIDAATARVRLPPLGERRADMTCYRGPAGSRDKGCRAAREDDTVSFDAGRPLLAREGLTVVVGVPKGIIAEPTALERTWWWLADRGIHWIAVPVLVFLGMLIAWRRTGRDPRVGEAVAVRYEPPSGLTPAEVGTIFDERADLDDVTSTILDLAIRGWLRIEEIPTTGLLFFSKTDYRLVRLPDPGGQRLKAHESEVLGALFAGDRPHVRLSDLRERFHGHLADIRDALYAVVSRQDGFFAAHPDHIRRRYQVMGFLVAVTAFFVLQAFGPIACASVVASGAIVALMGRAMPRRTRKGREAYEQILGLREFIRRVEADRLERLGGRTATTFEKVLPFAVVLGVADRWAEAFAGIYTAPPSWYVGPSFQDGFDTRDLVRGVGRSLDTMGRTFAAKPSGSGSGSSGFDSSGSSGGGFGGGGGGSW